MDRSVGKELKSLSNLIRRRLDSSPIIKETDNMTGTHFRAIAYLFDNRDRDVFQKDIEEEFRIRRSSATKLMQLMEKNGLITRESVNYDARLKKIVLTEKAQRLHTALGDNVRRLEQEMVKGISEERLRDFFDTLDMIKSNIENNKENKV